MKDAVQTLTYWLVQAAPYAAAMLLGLALKGCA